jgi:hypothetical protein
VVIPTSLEEPPRWVWFANWLCALLPLLAGFWAIRVMRSLDRALDKERDRMDEARGNLPLVDGIYRRHRGERDRRVSSTLQAVIIGGASFAILINLARAIAGGAL